MQIRNVLFILGFLLSSMSLCFLFPVLISAWYKEYSIIKPFLLCLSLGVGAGIALAAIFQPMTKQRFRLTTREGVAIVGLFWFLATVISGLPYFFIADVSLAKSCFEAASGLSTTGASIFSDVESLPRGLLFWRSFTQWLGGLGIIIFSLALLPFLGSGGMQLYKAEATGISKSKIAPRMVDTARSLWTIYIGLTILLAFLLFMQDMSFFAAINHAFTTMATGGFSINNTSIQNYSHSIQWTVILFMFLAGVNFTLHFSFLRRGEIEYFRNEECKYYICIVLGAVLIIAACLFFGNVEPRNLSGDTLKAYSVEEALRDSAFQVVSLVTTTGFATTDYLVWPIFCQVLLLLLMLIGSCTGSTSGGIKVIRILALFRFTENELNKLAHPQAVERIKMNGVSIENDVLRGVTSFFVVYWLSCLIGTLLISINGYDILTSFSAAITALSNVGPGFSLVGPAYNFGFMDDFSLSVLSVLMIMGRLELFTILLLFVPRFWRI